MLKTIFIILGSLLLIALGLYFLIDANILWFLYTTFIQGSKFVGTLIGSIVIYCIVATFLNDTYLDDNVVWNWSEKKLIISLLGLVALLQIYDTFFKK